jgi:hypothetical protein
VSYHDDVVSVRSYVNKSILISASLAFYLPLRPLVDELLEPFVAELEGFATFMAEEMAGSVHRLPGAADTPGCAAIRADSGGKLVRGHGEKAYGFDRLRRLAYPPGAAARSAGNGADGSFFQPEAEVLAALTGGFIQGKSVQPAEGCGGFVPAETGGVEGAEGEQRGDVTAFQFQGGGADGFGTGIFALLGGVF